LAAHERAGHGEHLLLAADSAPAGSRTLFH